MEVQQSEVVEGTDRATVVSCMTSACPILAALDIVAAAAWYREELGFRIALQLEDYAIVERDGVELHFWKCDERHIAENTSCYIRVDDVDELQRQFAGLANGGRISHVQSREWGMREFYVWDPSGNLLRFGQPERDGCTEDDSTKGMLEAFAKLSPEEQANSIAKAADAIREGRL